MTNGKKKEAQEFLAALSQGLQKKNGKQEISTKQQRSYDDKELNRLAAVPEHIHKLLIRFWNRCIGNCSMWLARYGDSTSPSFIEWAWTLRDLTTDQFCKGVRKIDKDPSLFEYLDAFKFKGFCLENPSYDELKRPIKVDHRLQSDTEKAQTKVAKNKAMANIKETLTKLKKD